MYSIKEMKITKEKNKKEESFYVSPYLCIKNAYFCRREWKFISRAVIILN